MPIIDERGRVFGRLNLVDAAVGVLLLALLPAAYLSYVLFRDPVPTLTAVVPAALRQGPGQQVEVRGEYFRPYMRVSFNDTQGATFLFYSPQSAFVQMPDLPPGKYDIVLYDYMRAVARMPGAFTVEPRPSATIAVEVRGFLTSLTAEQAKALAPGYRFPEGTTEILGVGPTEPDVLHIAIGDNSILTVPGGGLVQLPVRVRTHCLVETTGDRAQRCSVTAVPLGPNANVGLTGLNKALNLRVSSVHYPGRARTVTVRVRFLVSADLLGHMKRADQDLGAQAHPAGEMATLVSFSEKGAGNASMLRDERIRQSIPTDRLVIVEGVLTVPAQDSPLGWIYKESPLKVGSPFSFETAAYTMDGGVIEVKVED